MKQDGQTCFSGHLSAYHSLQLGLKHPSVGRVLGVLNGKVGIEIADSPTSQGCFEDLRSILYFSFLRHGEKQAMDFACSNLPALPA